jgi:hypothetical protein
VYQRAQRWPEQVKAMQAWGEALATAIDAHEQPQTARSPAVLDGASVP